VPQARQEPDQKQISVERQLAEAVSSQGKIDIISKPGSQGDMPAPPKLGDTPGDVGILEIFREGETEHFA